MSTISDKQIYQAFDTCWKNWDLPQAMYDDDFFWWHNVHYLQVVDLIVCAGAAGRPVNTQFHEFAKQHE